MSMKRSFPLIIAVVIALTPLLAACQPTPKAEPLVVLITNSEGMLTPTSYTSSVGFWMVGWVYDGLYSRDVDLNPVPSLATDALLSSDGLTWEITLREDVKWHDGEPFTAEDVAFSYGFLANAGHAPQLGVVERIEPRGDHALTITLKQPAPFFLRESLASTYILPEHIWRDVDPAGEATAQFQAAGGTGAYKLTAVVPGESFSFEANDSYFGGQPRVQAIRVNVVTDQAQREDQLRTGVSAAILDPITPTMVDPWEDVEGVTPAEGADLTNTVLYLNGARPPFDQTRVREAISMAIDTRALVNTVLDGRGMTLPSSYYHPDLPWAIAIPHVYDMDAARVLLEFSGLTDSDGDGVREWEGEPTNYTLLCNSDEPTQVQVATFITAALRNVGIGAQPRCIDSNAMINRIWPNFVAEANPNYDIALWTWPSDAQMLRGFLSYLVGDPGKSGWANFSGTIDPELDTLSASILTETDSGQREMISEQLQERFSSVLPMIPLISPNVSFAYRPEAYDGWVYVKGTGIMTVWSFLP